MKESELEKQCLEFLKLYPTIAGRKVKAGAQRHTFGGKSFMKKSTLAGMADILLCIHGKYIEVELKTETGKQSQVQKDHQEKIENAGGLYYIVRSFEQFKSIIESHV